MTIRCFLAIPIPENVRRELKVIQQRLKGLSDRVSWVRPESIHLTLKFFGEIRESDLPALQQLLQPIAAECRPVTLAAGGLGTFPSFRKPRVFWVGIQEDDSGFLTDLAERVEINCERIGYPREIRPFHPHLTLGRAKGTGLFTQLTEEMQGRSKDYSAGTFQADHLTFYRSILQPSGAVYKPLAILPFTS